MISLSVVTSVGRATGAISEGDVQRIGGDALMPTCILCTVLESSDSQYFVQSTDLFVGPIWRIVKIHWNLQVS